MLARGPIDLFKLQTPDASPRIPQSKVNTKLADPFPAAAGLVARTLVRGHDLTPGDRASKACPAAAVRQDDVLCVQGIPARQPCVLRLL